MAKFRLLKEESPVMVKSIHLDEDEGNEDADDEDDLSVSIVLTERHSSILDKWRSQMGKILGRNERTHQE